MYANIKFMNGIDPVGTKEKELAISEKKSHSARVAHKRRRAKREALLRSQEPSKVAATDRQTCGKDTHDCCSEHRCHSSQCSCLQGASRRQSADSTQDHSSDGATSLSASVSPTYSALQPVRSLFRTRQPRGEAYLMFDTPERMQAFEFWMRVTSPMTARYAIPYGDVYTKIIPQFAVNSTTVQHMILAHAYMHRKFIRGITANTQTLNSRALHHYSKGVQGMCSQISGTEFLAAAKLGFVYEACQNNFVGAAMHLRGYKAILNSFDGYRDDYFEQLAASHEVANTITSIMTHKKPGKHKEGSQYEGHLVIPWQGGSFNTTEGARKSIVTVMETIDEATARSDQDMLQGAKTSLSIWMDTIRSWDIEKEPSVKRSVILLLFNLATALLPVSKKGQLNYMANPLLMQHLFDSAETYFNSHRGIAADDREDLLETLTMLCDLTIRFVDLAEYRDRSKSLIRRIEGSQPRVIRGDESIVAKQEPPHVTDAEPSGTADKVEILLSSND